MSNDIAISASEARAVTDRIKTGVEAIWELIKDAYTRRAWEVLGYATWDDYCTREFGTSRIKLPREERQEVVASMRELGMSVRAIASATGTGKDTVARELRSGVANETPAPVTGTDGKTYTLHANPAREPVDIELNDGTTYKAHVETITAGEYAERFGQPSEQEKPKRKPITEAFNTTNYELKKITATLERLTKDDRFERNKNTIKETILSDLIRVRDNIDAAIAHLER